MDFSGKNILVVGGTSGIGASIVARLLNAGAAVWNISRSNIDHEKVNHITLDVSQDFNQIEGLPDQLDGLVYCPGSINLKPFQSLAIADYEAEMNINLYGAIRVIKASLKSLKASKNASVVLFSTVAVSQGLSFHAGIASAKGAVEGLTKSLAAEFSRQGIRFNAIAPSLTHTPLAAQLLSSDEKIKASGDRHPLKRVGTPEEMAAMASLLLSDESGWITGQILHVDGGMSSIRPM